MSASGTSGPLVLAPWSCQLAPLCIARIYYVNNLLLNLLCHFGRIQPRSLYP